jgi:hypothetical protein
LRRRALRAALLPHAVLYAVAGLVTIALSVISTPVVPVSLVAGCLLVVVAVVMARHDYTHWGHDLGARSTVWRTDRGHGQLFFRPADFADRYPSTVDTVVGIINAVQAIHTRPGADWTDPEQRQRLHHLAWDTLQHLHQCPGAEAEREPVIAALTLVATHTRVLNRRLCDIAATDTAEAMLTRITAAHTVLSLQPRNTDSGAETLP